MGLAVTLDLRHLHDRLVADARLGVGSVHGIVVEGLGREHEAIAEIAVVRDGEHLAARQLLVSVHELPEVRRILAVEGGKGNDLLHAVHVVAENDGAMKIVAVGHGSPFEAVQRGENARLVIPLGRFVGFRPSTGLELRLVDLVLVLGDGSENFPGGVQGLLRALLGHVVPFFAHRGGEQRGVATPNLIGQTQIFGMVGDGDTSPAVGPI